MSESREPLIRAIELLEECHQQIASEWNDDCHMCQDILAFLRGLDCSGCCDPNCRPHPAARAALERLDPKLDCCGGCGREFVEGMERYKYTQSPDLCERCFPMDWPVAERVLKDAWFYPWRYGTTQPYVDELKGRWHGLQHGGFAESTETPQRLYDAIMALEPSGI